MLQSIRLVLPRLPVEALACVGTGAAFFWLLAEGAIQPIAVYLLQLFLTF